MHPVPFAVLLLLVVSLSSAQRPPMNPEATVGVESCRDCHEEMVEAWEKSRHARSFETLASMTEATRMAQILKIEPADIPTTASCVRCHYTLEKFVSVPEPTEAISCESCHGSAIHWLDEHNRKSLSRQARIEVATEKGMIHPGAISTMVKSCFECHVVDDEQLVNWAGHPAISDDFEFLSWYSGEVKHNFLRQNSGGGVKSHTAEPQEIPPSRKRMLYLAGKLHHLAHTLQALSRSSDPPVDPGGEFLRIGSGRYTYAVQHALELKRLREDLDAILKRVSVREIAEALAVVRGLDLTTGANEEWRIAAQDVFQLADKLCREHDGSEFGALDPILEELKPRFSEN